MCPPLRHLWWWPQRTSTLIIGSISMLWISGICVCHKWAQVICSEYLYASVAVSAFRYVPLDAAAADGEYTDTGDVTCVPRCRGDVTFRAYDRQFSERWQAVWASLSLTSSLVTVLTFVVDSSRFRHPERPVVFIAVCRHVCSLLSVYS